MNTDVLGSSVAEPPAFAKMNAACRFSEGMSEAERQRGRFLLMNVVFNHHLKQRKR